VYDTNVVCPYQRLAASPDLADGVKAEPARRLGPYNPVKLQQEVHDAVDALATLHKKLNLEEVGSLAVSDLQAT
jgi:hypothetical protein